MRVLALLLCLLAPGSVLAQAPAPRRPAPARPAPRPARPQPPREAPKPTYFTSTLPPDALHNKQAVVETSAGTIVLDLLDQAAPNHVAHFMTRAREGAYNGTVFHRVVAGGIIQGGDPQSKEPALAERYGSGGLNELRFEQNAEMLTRGAVAAVIVPGQRDSAGSQFFICISPQPALDGQYTVFARVAEGLPVAQKISMAPADARGTPAERMVIRSVTIRDTPPPVPEPFSTETVEQLGRYRAVLETSMGRVTLGFMADKAPGHVRNFLRLAQAGVYDGTAFHRVVRGFMIQGGFTPSRSTPLDERQEAAVRSVPAEFNDTLHDKGIVSMARGDDPGSATTSFFIVTARTAALDGVYTAFARVLEGMDVVERIEGVAVQGETPVDRVDVSRVTVVGP